MKHKHIPTAYDALRKVPQNPMFIQEIQNRCLDLLLCPRQRKMRVNVNPDDLIPEVPKRSELKPFPEFQNTLYKGHTGMIRSISVSPDGCWLASGSDNARTLMHIKAPKQKFPGHELSYNPPPEYLPTKEEREQMENPADSDEELEMKHKHIPTAYDALRKVPQNPMFIQEIQNRCLDLLLCPRQRKMRVNVNPDDLIPEVP